jgi:putative tryptophan/tyrosine transport system substrate-binding protein
MRRREFIALVSGAAAWPVVARAQQSERVRRIGVLMAFAESDPAGQSELAGFRDELKKLGWKEGNNLRIELRWGAGEADRIKTFAKELVDLRPDAIFGQTTSVIGALARETRTIPIVFAVVSDPIGKKRSGVVGRRKFARNDALSGAKLRERGTRVREDLCDARSH